MIAGVCRETWRRIMVTVWAYAYEFHDDPLVDDETFDRIASEIDLTKSTKRPDLDAWFRKNFDPSTGMWVRSHPELNLVEAKYQRLKSYGYTPPKPVERPVTFEEMFG